MVPIAETTNSEERTREDGHNGAAMMAQIEPPQQTIEEQLHGLQQPAGVGDPVDAAPVVGEPEDRAVLGAGEHRSLVRAVGQHQHVLGTVAGQRVDLGSGGGRGGRHWHSLS